MKFRGHAISEEDRDHIRLHVEGLCRTLYNCQAETAAEDVLLRRAVAEAESIHSTVAELLKGAGSV